MMLVHAQESHSMDTPNDDITLSVRTVWISDLHLGLSLIHISEPTRPY